MGKINQTANEAQLKARRTSLGKKTVDELITIILRKDKSERSMNSKIQELQASLKKANELYEDTDACLSDFKKDMNKMSEIIKVKQEQIDNLISERISLKDEYNNALKKIIHLKNICKFRRNVSLTCFIVIIILITIMCIV